MNNRRNTIFIIKRKNRIPTFRMLLERSKSIVESVNDIDNLTLSIKSYRKFKSEMNDLGMINVEQFSIGVAMTVFQYTFNENKIVVDINPKIVFNISMIDIIYHELSLHDLMVAMDNITKHEIGHILDFRKHHIGITLSELKDISEEYKKEYETLNNEMMETINNIAKKERMDAFYKYSKKYHQIEIEKRANAYFNLSWEDFYQVDEKIHEYLLKQNI